MNIILEYSVQVKVPLFTISNIEFPLLCAFMDDLSIMSRCVKSVQIQNFFWSVSSRIQTECKVSKYIFFSGIYLDTFQAVSSTVSGALTLPSQCTAAVTWIELKFRADKSCSIVIIKGVYEHNTFFCFKSNRLTRTFIFHPFKTNYVFGLLNPNLGGGGNLPHPPPPQLVFP